ncbi:cytochrome P450, partial [Rhizoctonia solani]
MTLTGPNSPLILLDSLLHPGGGNATARYLAPTKYRELGFGLGVLAVISARLVYVTLKRANAFRSLDGPKPASFIFGNEMLLFLPETSLSIHDECLGRYGSVCKFKGMMGEDLLWIADPRAINEIILKEYDCFHSSEGFVTWTDLAFGPNLVTATGHKHKIQRKVLNPVFTASHLRNLVLLGSFYTEARHLEGVITAMIGAGGSNTGIIDVEKWMSNVGLEMIGQAGVGHSFGIMSDKEPEYLGASRQVFPLIHRMWYIRPFLPTLTRIGSARFRRFVVGCISFGPIGLFRKATEVLDKLTGGILAQKRQALADGNLESEVAAGKDMISMLLKQSQGNSSEERMSEQEILGNINALIFAGHETTSGGLARTLHLLAQHPDVQNQLRAEVRDAHGLHGKDLDYDQINSLKYLDAICRESLRLWSPIQLLERVATKDSILPLQNPIKLKDGKNTTEKLHVPRGTRMYVSLGSVNRDKRTWGEDAEDFKPARWLQPLPSTVAESKIPGVYSNLYYSEIVLSALISSFIFELGSEEHTWTSAAVVKPHAQKKDGTIEPAPSLRMKVTIVED